MKRYESLPKVLPVPDHLDAKILRHAADLAARRRRDHFRHRIFFGVAAAAAALVVATFVLLPEKDRPQPPVVAKAEVPEWSALDQESFVLSAELNQCNRWDEEFSI